MVEARYPEKAEHIYTLLEHIHLYEKAQEPDVDLASGCFGEIMGEILACRKDEWEDDLRRMGFFLGKFIYLMDAYEDMEKDEKDGNYNVFLLRRKKLSDDEAFEQEAYQILQMMMAECSRIFEKLPILEHAEILRNILYSGVWCRYEMIQKRGNKGCVTLIRYLACLRMRRRKKSKGISETEPDVSSGCQYQQSEQGAGGRKI